MGGVRRGIWFIASGLALFALLFFLSEAELLLVPCKLDTPAKAHLIPIPVIHNDGTIQILNPPFRHNPYYNLRAVARDGDNIEVVETRVRNDSGHLTVTLDSELVANFNKFNSISLASCYFSWRYWQTQGDLKIYNIGRDKKKVELYFVLINRFYKKLFAKFDLIDNTLILSTHSCKRFLFWTTAAASVIAEFSIFIGFLLIVCDIVSALIRCAKRTLAKNVR
jgi:hypothetical protein